MKIQKIQEIASNRNQIALGLLLIIGAFLPYSNASASTHGANRNAGLLVKLMRDKGWNVRDTFTRGLMKRGTWKVYPVTLYQGNYYKLIAAGCEDAYDVDLVVLDANKNIVGEDTDNAPLAAVDVVPNKTGTFLIAVKMYKSTPNGAHFVVQYGFKNLKAAAPSNQPPNNLLQTPSPKPSAPAAPTTPPVAPPPPQRSGRAL